jgi:GxxExxY protein
VNQRPILFRKEVYAIVGAALEVLRELGHGIHEKPYERALAVELSLRNLPYRQQTPFDIFYKKVKVGQFTPDLVVLGKIIVDTKVIEKISKSRTRTDAELPQDHQLASRCNIEFSIR